MNPKRNQALVMSISNLQVRFVVPPDCDGQALRICRGMDFHPSKVGPWSQDIACTMYAVQAPDLSGWYALSLMLESIGVTYAFISDGSNWRRCAFTAKAPPFNQL